MRAVSIGFSTNRIAFSRCSGLLVYDQDMTFASVTLPMHVNIRCQQPSDLCAQAPTPTEIHCRLLKPSDAADRARSPDRLDKV